MRTKTRSYWTPQRIRALRQTLKLTQAAAAARVRITRESWACWEIGSRTPKGSMMLLLDLMEEGKL